MIWQRGFISCCFNRGYQLPVLRLCYRTTLLQDVDQPEKLGVIACALPHVEELAHYLQVVVLVMLAAIDPISRAQHCFVVFCSVEPQRQTANRTETRLQPRAGHCHAVPRECLIPQVMLEPWLGIGPDVVDIGTCHQAPQTHDDPSGMQEYADGRPSLYRYDVPASQSLSSQSTIV